MTTVAGKSMGFVLDSTWLLIAAIVAIIPALIICVPLLFFGLAIIFGIITVIALGLCYLWDGLKFVFYKLPRQIIAKIRSKQPKEGGQYFQWRGMMHGL